MGLIEDAMKRRTSSGSRPISRPKPVQALGINPDRVLPTAVRVEPDESHALEFRLICPEQDRAAVSAYKMLRTQVVQKMRANGWRSIGVTATKGGEGKTLTAINLALSLANQPDQDVVLVDLDLHRHTVATYLGIEDHGELLDVLDGAPLNEGLIQYGDRRLFMLLNDTRVPNSSERLAGPEAANLVEQVRGFGGIAIYDLPPLLYADDYLAFSSQVDCTLLVVSEGETERAELLRAKELLNETELVGIVLNKSKERALMESYYY